MRMLISALLLIAVGLVASCQGQAVLPEREASAASCAQDVVDAWNLHCDYWGFDSVQLSSMNVMGNLYSGDDFEQDSDDFMQAIQAELMVGYWPDPEIDDPLSSVIDFNGWYS